MVREPPNIVPKWLFLVAFSFQILAASLVFLAARYLTNCGLVSALVIALISAISASIPGMILAGFLVARFVALRKLGLSLFVSHLQQGGPSCDCDICERAKKIFNSEQDRLDILFGLTKQRPR